MIINQSLNSEKLEGWEIWAMFTSVHGPTFVMSRADAQNELDFHFKLSVATLFFMLRKFINFCFTGFMETARFIAMFVVYVLMFNCEVTTSAVQAPPMMDVASA